MRQLGDDLFEFLDACLQVGDAIGSGASTLTDARCINSFRRRCRHLAAEQVCPGGVLPPGRARKSGHERAVLTAGQRLQYLARRIVVGERVQPATAGPQLAGCLRASQQQQADNGELCWREPQPTEGGVAQSLLELLHTTAEVLVAVHQVTIGELPRGALDRAGIQR